MTEWIAGDVTATITTGVATAVELFANDFTPLHERTIVDGFVYIVTDTNDLCVVRLIGPAPNLVVAGDFSATQPLRSGALSWYWLFCGGAPILYRTRSKRTFSANQELWVQIGKLRGTTSTIIDVGWQFLLTD